MKISAAALLIVLSVARLAAGDVRVTLVREGRVWVSFGVDDGLTPELRQAVLSGLPVTFTYDIELRRGVPFWPDRALEANTEYYVRVRARTTPHHSLMFWPWDRGLVSTNANFTFIP